VVTAGEVRRDPEQPRRGIAVALVVSRARGPGQDEHLGREILGEGRRQTPAQLAVDAGVVTLEELLEGPGARCDELRVGAGHCRPHTDDLPDARFRFPRGFGFARGFGFRAAQVRPASSAG
jgi:hypothetical protein